MKLNNARQTTALTRYILPPLFAAAMLFAQNAHAGWILEWIKCSESCGFVCDCSGEEYSAFKPQNPQEKKAAEEIKKVMESFKSNIRSLSPDAKKLLKKLDSKGS